MAIPLGGLVTGLTRALTGYQAGKYRGQQERRQQDLQDQDRQRQARQDMLAQQLLGAQLGNYQSLAQERQRSTEAAQARAQRQAEAAARIRATQGLDPRLAALPDDDLITVVRTQATQAPRNIDPLGEQGMNAQVELVRRGVRRDPNVVIQRQPQVTEREKASAGVDASRANLIIDRLEAADPTIGARVARKAAVRRSIVAGLSRRIAGISDEQAQTQIESTIEQSMTPDELEYYAASKDYLGSVLPGLSGKAVTAREWVIQAPRFFSLGATTPQVMRNRAAARRQRIQRFFAEAGAAAPEIETAEPEAPPPVPPRTVGGRPVGRTVDPSRFFRP